MTSVHADPKANGTKFGNDVWVTIDTDQESVRLLVTRDHSGRSVSKRPWFHNVDEVQAGYHSMQRMSHRSVVAAEMADALKFAAQQIRNHRKGR